MSVMVMVALNLEGGRVVVVMSVMVVVEAGEQLAVVLRPDAVSCFEALHGRRCQTYDHSVCLLLSSGRFFSAYEYCLGRWSTFSLQAIL